jgi:hypothetical protein
VARVVYVLHERRAAVMEASHKEQQLVALFSVMVMLALALVVAAVMAMLALALVAAAAMAMLALALVAALATARASRW